MQIKEQEVTQIRKLGEDNGWRFEPAGGRAWKAYPPDINQRPITFRETAHRQDVIKIVTKFERAGLDVLPQYRNGGRPDKEPRKRNVLGIDPPPRETLTTTVAEATGMQPPAQKPLPCDLDNLGAWLASLPTWVKSAKWHDHARRRCHEDNVGLLEVLAALEDPDREELSHHDTEGDRTVYYRGDVKVVFGRSGHFIISVYAPAGPNGERRASLGDLPAKPVTDATPEDIVRANQDAADAAAESTPGRATPHVTTPVVMDRKRTTTQPETAAEVDPSELTGTDAVDYYMRELAMPGDLIDVAEVHRLLFPKSKWMSFRIAFYRRHLSNPEALPKEGGNCYRVPAVEQPPAPTPTEKPAPVSPVKEPVVSRPQTTATKPAAPVRPTPAVLDNRVHKPGPAGPSQGTQAVEWFVTSGLVEPGGEFDHASMREQIGARFPYATDKQLYMALARMSKDGAHLVSLGGGRYRRPFPVETTVKKPATKPTVETVQDPYPGIHGGEVAITVAKKLAPGERLVLRDFLAKFPEKRHSAVSQGISRAVVKKYLVREKTGVYVAGPTARMADTNSKRTAPRKASPAPVPVPLEDVWAAPREAAPAVVEPPAVQWAPPQQRAGETAPPVAPVTAPVPAPAPAAAPASAVASLQEKIVSTMVAKAEGLDDTDAAMKLLEKAFEMAGRIGQQQAA
jgi:hypothetical protein